MSLTRTLARPLLASMFVIQGFDAARNPGARVAPVEAAGLKEAEKLVRANGATQAVAGLTLATGRLPRLSALVLAGSLIPTTYVGHPFWSAPPELKKQERVQFLKNLSMLGGLLLHAADQGGRESLPHAVSRVSSRTVRRAEKVAAKASKKAARTSRKASKSGKGLLPTG